MTTKTNDLPAVVNVEVTDEGRVLVTLDNFHTATMNLADAEKLRTDPEAAHAFLARHRSPRSHKR